MKTTDNQKELFVVVDKNDKIIGYKTRKECHSDKSLIHRAVSVVIFNKKGDVALQKRSQTKDLYPGYHTVSASGHVDKGESYEETAKREMFEEIGVKLPITFVTKLLLHMPHETEFDAIFRAESEGPFDINKKEVESLEFYSKKDIKKMKDKFTPSAFHCLTKLGLL